MIISKNDVLKANFKIKIKDTEIKDTKDTEIEPQTTRSKRHTLRSNTQIKDTDTELTKRMMPSQPPK